MRASRGANLVSVVLLAVALTGCGASSPSAGASSVASPAASASADYTRAYQAGLAAYTYGLPLVVMNLTFETMTSVTVSSGAFGPANQFNNEKAANGASSTAVVAPGSTSLSSIAWLDLSAEPQVLHVPQVTDHFFVLALLNPYTENLVNLGTASGTKPGDYVIAGPGQGGVALPAGTQRINVDASRIWIIGSTQLKGPDDVAAVGKIQDGYTLTPLSKYGTSYTPAPAASPVTTATQAAMPVGLAFFDMLGEQLATFPPPAADAPTLATFAAVGIGPGKSPSSDASLSADTKRGLTDAVAAGPAQMKTDIATEFASSAAKHNGYLLGGFGTYGTDYTLRAVISQVGLGAFLPQQAIYAMTWSDHTGSALAGSTSYVLHLAAAPPTNEGWSVTLYNLQGALIANPLNRYAFSDSSQLTKNSDGSIDLYLASTQPTDPAQAANWLPTAAGQGFEVTWRLFAPQASAMSGVLDGSGWQPPAIEIAK